LIPLLDPHPSTFLCRFPWDVSTDDTALLLLHHHHLLYPFRTNYRDIVILILMKLTLDPLEMMVWYY
jgi:hypothetical protein